MAAKSIIDIDVNDGKFKSFIEAFDKYQKALKKLPGAWEDANKAVDETVDSIIDMTDDLNNQLNIIVKKTREQEKMRRGVDKTNTSMKGLADNTNRVYRSIKDITLSLAKWSSLTAAFGVLSGGTGLFGFEQLARSASAARRASMGLGIAPNELQAANISMERYGGAEPLLSRIADIKNDVSQQYRLTSQLGISQQDVANKSSFELLPQVAQSLRSRYLAIPESQRGTLAPALGLTEFGGLDFLRTLGQTPEGELGRQFSAMRSRASQIGGSNTTNERYQTFLESLEASLTGMRVRVIDKLVGLSEPITHLVTAFSNLVNSGLESQTFRDGIQSFARFIEDVAKGNFREAFFEFASNVQEAADKLLSFARWIGLLSRPAAAPGGGVGTGLPPDVTDALGAMGLRPMSYGGKFGELERSNNLPAGMLEGIYQIESGGGRNVGPSRAGALGPFQFMPATAAAYGVNNPMDLDQSSRGAATMMADLMRQFGNDPMKAAAAYNWGSGNLTRAIRQYGSDWLSHAPKETQSYVSRLGSMIGQGGASVTAMPGQGVKIVIYDATGGNAVNVAAQLAPMGIAL
jgi:soluble lytic murein transglycosylase-like protein